MSRKAVYNDIGSFMGYIYNNQGERFYAPAKGFTDIDLECYCSLVF